MGEQKFITANPVLATILFKANFEMTDERKIIDGNATWTFTVPVEKYYAFARIRKEATGHEIRL